MKISELLRKTRQFADTNSPVILTGMAVSGAFISVYLAAKGGYKASQALSEEAPDMSNQERFIRTYRFYIPAAGVLAGTSACMVMATKIGLDRTAAMAGALVVSERTYDQYKEKTRELLGEPKHTKVRDAIAQDQVAAAPFPSQILLSEGEQWCYDMWSGRYFRSTMEDLKQAVNKLNYELLSQDVQSLSDFYDWVGLDHTQESDNIGWRVDPGRPLEVTFTSVLKGDKACIAFQFEKHPMPGF